MSVRIVNLQKNFGKQTLWSGLNIQVEKGEVVSLLGVSGVGKTTLLRCLAGIEEYSDGEIHLDGQKRLVKNYDGKIGLLTQDLSLFPHLNVHENIGFALHNWSTEEREQRVKELLELCRIPELADRSVQTLSGGQKQRVALARALAARPSLLLFDEPFSSLDPKLRFELACEIRELLKQQNITAIFVTHLLDEAYSISDKIGILSQGKILQWGTPEELIFKPHSKPVLDFVGDFGILNESGRQRYLLPSDLVLVKEGSYQARIKKIYWKNTVRMAEVETDKSEILNVLFADSTAKLGESIHFNIRPEARKHYLED